MNSSLRTLALLALGALVGAGATLWLTPSRESEPSRDGPDPAPAVDDSDEPQSADESPPLTPAPGETITTRVPDPWKALTESVVTELRTGNGRIEGQVRDTFQRPLAGATVRLELRSPEPTIWDDEDKGAGPPPLDDLESVLHSNLVHYAKQQANRRQTTTDTEGRFVLDGLPDATWTIQAWREGYELRPDPWSNRVRTGGRVDYIGTEMLEQPLRVLDTTGEPARSALIECRQTEPRALSRPLHYEWTPDQASLHLPVGRYELRAFVRHAEEPPVGLEDWPLRSPHADLSLVAGVTPEPIELTVAPCGGVYGQVNVLPDPSGPYAPFIAIVRTPTEGTVSADLLQEPIASSSLTGQREYFFEGLEPGRYSLAVAREHRAEPVVVREVSIGQRFERFDFVLPPAPEVGFIEAHVVGPDGRPLAEVRYMLRERRGRGGGGAGSTSRAKSDGLHRISIPRTFREAWLSSEPGVRFSLELSHPEFGTRALDVHRTTDTLEVRFEEAARVRVQVNGLTGASYEDRLRVAFATDEAPRPGWQSAERVPRNGSFESGNRQPGTYGLVIFLVDEHGGREVGTVIHSSAHELAPGWNDVELAIPALHTVRVRGGDRPGRVPVHLEALSEDRTAPRFGGPYRYDSLHLGDQPILVRGVPPGRYQLRVAGRQQTITVPTDEIVLE